MSERGFRADVARRERFLFDVTFDEETWAPVVVDEPEPLGSGAGPNPARLLAGAVGSCLAASLVLCLEKARVPLHALTVRVEGTMSRNEPGRLRIAGLTATMKPAVEGPSGGRFDRCLDIFEEFCIVTQSVRAGIDVDVRVEPTFEESGKERVEEAFVGAGS